MSNFSISEWCPHLAIVQHYVSSNEMDSYDRDYSEYGNVEKAWEFEQSSEWVKKHKGGIEAAKSEFIGTLYTYNQVEILIAANDGHDWPYVLGFVDSSEDRMRVLTNPAADSTAAKNYLRRVEQSLLWALRELAKEQGDPKGVTNAIRDLVPEFDEEARVMRYGYVTEWPACYSNKLP